MIEIASANMTSTATPNEYFSQWVDHENWPLWSPDTEWVKVTGTVEKGTHGKLKPKRGPVVKFIISTYEPPTQYTDTSYLFGAHLVFQHTVEQLDGHVELKVNVWIEGFLEILWAKVFGSRFKESVAEDLKRLVHLVEKQ